MWSECFACEGIRQNLGLDGGLVGQAKSEVKLGQSESVMISQMSAQRFLD